MISTRRNRKLLAAAGLIAGLAAFPVAADTTVAEYLKMEKQGQAHLLGGMLQSLAEDLQKRNQTENAECLVSLYSAESEARVVRSPGMTDFLRSVEVARENDPEKTTVEEIITRQLVQYCGYSGKN